MHLYGGLAEPTQRAEESKRLPAAGQNLLAHHDQIDCEGDKVPSGNTALVVFTSRRTQQHD